MVTPTDTCWLVHAQLLPLPSQKHWECLTTHTRVSVLSGQAPLSSLFFPCDGLRLLSSRSLSLGSAEWADVLSSHEAACFLPFPFLPSLLTLFPLSSEILSKVVFPHITVSNSSEITWLIQTAFKKKNPLLHSCVSRHTHTF